MGYVFIDIETTGLDAGKSFITEIAAIKTNGYGDIEDSLQRLVRLPKGETVPTFITELTGITDDMLAEQGRDFDLAIGELEEFIGDAVVVAQYAPFDLSFIERHFEVLHFFDTRTLAYALDLPSANLEGLAAHYGIEMGKHHRAMDDASTCRYIFFAQAFDMESKMMNVGDYLNVVGTKPERIPSVYPTHTIHVVDYAKKEDE